MGVSEGERESDRTGAGLDEASATAVGAIARHSAGVEPSVTATMVAIARRYRAVELVGLQNRLKSADSMIRKVTTAIRGSGGRGRSPLTLVEALGSMNDVVRYTAVLPDAYFDRGAQAVMGEMVSRGLVHVRTKNTFGQAGYQGCNTTWRAPGGMLFEVQFHSPQSWAVTQETHGLYEELRITTNPDDHEILGAKIRAAYLAVQSPPGAHRVSGPPENGHVRGAVVMVGDRGVLAPTRTAQSSAARRSITSRRGFGRD